MTAVRRTLSGFGIAIAAAGLGWAAAASAATGSAAAGKLSGDALIDALRQGGYVIVMRHAHSPQQQPDAAHARPGNKKHERQLDAAGERAARYMGMAIRQVEIPILRVLSSPTFRAIETARALGLGAPHSFPELGPGGADMKSPADRDRAQWLESKVAAEPPDGENLLIITHEPNLKAAFGPQAAQMQAGDALVFEPDGKTAKLVAKVKIDEWLKLADHWKPKYQRQRG